MTKKNANNMPSESIAPQIREESVSSPRAMKIMVVDDESYILDIICEFLSEKGFEVFTAESGEEAVERFEQVRPDILIVDYKMKGMDGLETIERITRISPTIVSIFMTGFPTLDTSIKALRLGAADYILKPFKIEEVGLSVQKAVAEWRLKEELYRLRDKISKLEGGISDKKEKIKINKKLGVIAGPYGYSAKFTGLPGGDSGS